MGFERSRRLGHGVLICVGFALAACQGNIGGGSGLSIPQAPGYGQPAGPGGGGQTQSRERVLDGAVYLSSKLTEVPLPELGGFAVTIALGTPGPVTASTEAAATALPSLHGAARRAALAHGLSSPSPGASGSASAAASPAASGTGSSASPQPSGSASAAASPAASASGPASSPKPGHSPSPAAVSQSEHPHIDTKTTIYPDDAPPPPTPVPTGEVQTFVHRTPIVRGYVLVGSDVPIYGLGAIHFTLPQTELTPKRGFTIALFESGKHRHERLMNFDNEPIVGEGVVYSGQKEPVVLKKGKGYLLLIYGDDEPAAPSSLPAGYPPPGNNPFPVPSGSGYPQPSYTQVNNPYGTASPYNPYAPATPYNPNPATTPYNPYAPQGQPTSPFGMPHP